MRRRGAPCLSVRAGGAQAFQGDPEGGKVRKEGISERKCGVWGSAAGRRGDGRQILGQSEADGTAGRRRGGGGGRPAAPAPSGGPSPAQPQDGLARPWPRAVARLRTGWRSGDAGRGLTRRVQAEPPPHGGSQCPQHPEPVKQQSKETSAFPSLRERVLDAPCPAHPCAEKPACPSLAPASPAHVCFNGKGEEASRGNLFPGLSGFRSLGPPWCLAPCTDLCSRLTLGPVPRIRGDALGVILSSAGIPRLAEGGERAGCAELRRTEGASPCSDMGAAGVREGCLWSRRSGPNKKQGPERRLGDWQRH